MPRYKLTVAYDGTDFHGWQKQEIAEPNDAPRPPVPVFDRRGRTLILRTVQEVLERAVRAVVREPVNLVGASRTDAGVHAWGQVAAFSCSPADTPDTPAQAGATSRRVGGWPADRGLDRLIRAINSRLPADVLVRSAEVVPCDFQPISGATAKAYTYTMHVGMDRPLWDRDLVFHTWRPLDIQPMRDAAAALVGVHDFAAFAAAGHGRQSTVREIFSCDIAEAAAPHGPDSARRIVLTLSGNGFLYNMVRIIAGTLHEVGRGRIDASDVAGIIAGRDRSRAGPTLPPQGLRLEWVRYDRSAPTDARPTRSPA